MLIRDTGGPGLDEQVPAHARPADRFEQTWEPGASPWFGRFHSAGVCLDRSHDRLGVAGVRVLGRCERTGDSGASVTHSELDALASGELLHRDKPFAEGVLLDVLAESEHGVVETLFVDSPPVASLRSVWHTSSITPNTSPAPSCDRCEAHSFAVPRYVRMGPSRMVT